MSRLARPSFLPLSLFLALLAMLPSCALAVGAAIGAGGVYAMGDDAARVYLEAPLDDVLAATRAIVEDHGEVERDDPGAEEAILEWRDDEYRYTIEMTALTDSTTELVVHARRWARLAPAQDEATRLADRIAYRVDA